MRFRAVAAAPAISEKPNLRHSPLHPENYIKCRKNYIGHRKNYIRHNSNYIRPFFAACKSLKNKILQQTIFARVFPCNSKLYAISSMSAVSSAAIRPHGDLCCLQSNPPFLISCPGQRNLAQKHYLCKKLRHQKLCSPTARNYDGVQQIHRRFTDTKT